MVCIALLLRTRHDIAQFVGFIRCGHEIRLLLLKVGEAQEFGIGKKFGHRQEYVD